MAKLIYAASPESADMFYATKFHAPDAFYFLEHRGKRTIILSNLEIDRGKKEARVDEILSLTDLVQSAKKKGVSEDKFMAPFLRSRRIRRVEVPASFPLGVARSLEEAGVAVDVVRGHFWQEREIKTPAEIRHLRHSAKLAQHGILRGVEILRAAKIGKGRRLYWGGSLLTSEILRAEIEIAILREGGLADGTIVAGGRQACDPHERGRGALKANELIILDVFPRDRKTGYFGDLTRTVVRGKATEAQRKLWKTVCEAHDLAIYMIRPEMSGPRLQYETVDLFRNLGYPTEQKKGRWTGFFHGLGHGLGLELHESPRIATTEFKTGQVFTVEPGLYYPEIGGARHENMIVVTEKGNRMLSDLNVPLEL